MAVIHDPNVNVLLSVFCIGYSLVLNYNRYFFLSYPRFWFCDIFVKQSRNSNKITYNAVSTSNSVTIKSLCVFLLSQLWHVMQDKTRYQGGCQWYSPDILGVRHMRFGSSHVWDFVRTSVVSIGAHTSVWILLGCPFSEHTLVLSWSSIPCRVVAEYYIYILLFFYYSCFSNNPFFGYFIVLFEHLLFYYSGFLNNGFE